MALDPGPVQPSPAVHVRIDVAPVVEQQAIKDETELIEDDRVDVQAVSPGLKAMRER